MNIDIISLSVGLAILIIVNIVLGSVNALFERSFDWAQFRRGLGKGFVVSMCFLLVYGVGWLNPDVVAVSIDGTDVNLLTAVHMILMAGFLVYAKEVCVKLGTLIKGSTKVESIKGE